MWWPLIPIVAFGAKLLYDYWTQDSTSERPAVVIPTRRADEEVLPPLPTRGTFAGDLALVIGRTGAGKSSVVNLLKGEQLLPVGDVGSTTRWLEGIPLPLASRSVTLVDSPGVGEAFTDADYNRGIVEWYRRQQHAVRCLMLVLQADAKAHADDKRLVDDLRSVADRPLLVVLNQVDKVRPVRDELEGDSWEAVRRRQTAKGRHIEDKIRVVGEQFRQPGQELTIVPVISEPGHSFNRVELLRELERIVTDENRGIS